MVGEIAALANQKGSGMHDMIVADRGVRAGRREWIGLAVLALPTLLVSIDVSVLFLALPHLSADLGAGSTQQLWILDIYGFMLAGFLVTMGTLGDRIGRRRLLLIGAAAFGVASLLAAYSTSPEMLIATRAVLGVAGATLMPSTLALIGTMFRAAEQRALAIGLWVICVMVGMVIGPLVGGALLESFWWGSVFLIAVPMMVLLLIAAPALLPEYRDPDAGRLDLTSVALSLATILPVIYGLKELAKDGPSALAVFAVAVGVAFGVAFVRRQRRLPSPLLDLRLFADRTLSAALGIMLLGGAILGGVFLLVSQYLQLIEGLSPLAAGLWLLPAVGAAVVGVLLAPLVARRFRPAYVVAGGLAIAAIGLLLLTQVGSASGLAAVVIGFAYINLGTVPLAAIGTDLIVGSAPPEQAGSASSLSETGSEFGFALGVAALGSIGTAVYRNQVADAIPAGTPAPAAEATMETLAGATAAVVDLPAELGAALLTPARDAFTSGLHTVAGFSAVLLVAVAVVAVSALRHIRPSGAPEPDAARPAGAAQPIGAVQPSGMAPPSGGAVQPGGAAVQPAGVGTRPSGGAVQPGGVAVPSGGWAVAERRGVVQPERVAGTVLRGLRHLPGHGVLARYGELVLLCEAPAGQDSKVEALVDELAAAASQQCGRQLSRRLVGLLGGAGQEEFPALCAFGPAGDGVAAVVHGRAEVTLTSGGRQLRLNGRDAVTVVDRVVGGPVESIQAVLGDGNGNVSVDRWSRLVAGVVRADALVLQLATTGTPPALALPAQPMPALPPTDPPAAAAPGAPPAGAAPAATVADPPAATPPAADQPAGAPDTPATPMPAMPAPPAGTVPAGGAGAGPPAAPVPAEGAAAAPPAEAPETDGEPAVDAAVVVGLYCKKSHFNDPVVAYCSVCGLAMSQSNRVPVSGPRPQLGVLVLDDGTMLALTRDHVFGRLPESDPAVAAGRARPVLLPDPLVSRVHARVELRGWDVTLVDAGSVNGTFVCAPDETAWTRLPSGASVALRPGSAAAVGNRQLWYYSHRNH